MKTRKNKRPISQKVNGYARIIKMERETAIDQLLAVLAHLDATEQGPVTMEFTDFTDEECFEFDKKMLEIIALRSKVRGRGYYIDFQPSATAAS
jgi:hypothetical protein